MGAVLTSTTFGFGSLADLGYTGAAVSVTRGTMGGKVCVAPAGKNFVKDVSVTVTGTLFRVVPEKLAGKPGEGSVCGALGTA